MKLAVLVAGCVLLVFGTQMRAQQSQPAPNAPASNVPAAPAPQAGSSANTKGSLNSLLDNVTPGEGTTNSSSNAGSAQQTQPAQTQPPPPANTPAPVVPPSGQGPSTASYTFRTNVNFVLVPVTVKDSKGQLVAGLTYRDFQIYEDGVRQRIRFFTVDPFPLSVAFVIDQSLPADTMAKVNDALSALQGAFAPYDEVAVYTYASHVRQATGFTGARSDRLTVTLQRVKSPGDDMGIPTNTGPLAEGPIINGHTVDPNTTPLHNGTYVGIIPQDIHTLNDAIFKAATDLSQRGRGRRKLIYVISDGKEHGSKISYKEVVRYLLTNKIAVYGTLVGDSATPVLGFLDKYHLPLLPTTTDNILPRYTKATGGQLDAELSRNGIERSFARIADQVRNQYTLGYDSHISLLDSRFRSIDVRVLRPNLTVIARQGFYPSATSLR